MRSRGCGYLIIVLTSLVLIGQCSAYAAGSRLEKAEAAAPEITPQLVRIRYLEGDVRVSRAVASNKAPKADWEVAVQGLPIQTGYDIATGADGRAEIEFEDASTVYLAENSVLAFNDIHSTDGVPYTSLALLTGTMTMHTEESGDSSKFLVKMPVGGVVAASDQTTYLRLSSFLDGFAISARAPVKMRLPDETSPVTETPQEKTIYYVGSKIVQPPADPAERQRLADWDKWVDQRVHARTTEMAAVMQQSGIDRPLPGLADLYQKGTFFKCEPYGTCWVPGQPDPASQAPPAVEDASARGGPAAPSFAGGGQDPFGYPYRWRLSSLLGMGFPCDPEWMFDASIDPNWTSYDWGLCSYGWWVPCNRGYAWVVPATQPGPRHLRYRVHPFPPVRWVKYGGKKGFVPRNPRDEPGKPPLNREHGIFLVHGRSIQHVPFSPRTSMETLREEPSHFLRPVYSHLVRASAPRPEIRSLRPTAKLLAAGRTESPVRLAYNHNSQSFLLKGPVEMHGRTVERMQSFAGRNGALQARATGVTSRGVYNTSISYGGFVYGRIGASYGIRGVSTFASSNSGFSSSSGGFSGGSFSGSSGGSMPSASGGPVGASGGARR